jgi:flagellar hook-basal body complex protein FliE
MDLYIGQATLGLPVSDLTKGVGQLNLNRGSLGTLEQTLGENSVEEKSNFANMLLEALNDASRTQNEADNLVQLAITDPESVDVHEVTIAMAKANMSLSISKAIIDRSISGFKDILNQR